MMIHRNQTGDEPLVQEAASEVRNYCYNYRESLLAGIIVAGWDKKYGGQVYQIPLGGMLHRSTYAIGGSGSSYIHGFIREHYRENMSQEECLAFVKKCEYSLFDLPQYMVDRHYSQQNHIPWLRQCIPFCRIKHSTLGVKNQIYSLSFLFFLSPYTAVFHAMSCDGSSGGVCRTGIITKDGIVRQTHYAAPEPMPSRPTLIPTVGGVQA